MSCHNNCNIREGNADIHISSPKRKYVLDESHHSKTLPTRPLKRYSLSDTWFSLSSNKQNKMSCNIHASMKIDSDSPGYSTRVVQYRNEQDNMSMPTYQKKYDKLGVFPIVHFFKKQVPLLKKKQNDGGSKISTPEMSKYNSPEHNQMLLEKIIRSTPTSEVTNDRHDANAKSVLDALKEISRKRIHSNEKEEFILKEDGKRLHSDCENETNARKRQRQNSSQNENMVDKTNAMNELMASHSSMVGCVTKTPQKEDVAGQKCTPSKSATSPVKYVDVETQTILHHAASHSVVDVTTPKEDVNFSSLQRETRLKKTSPIQIFDETPLERMRRNKLTALVGAVTSNRIESEEIKNTVEENKPTINKPLVSILSGNNKSPNKSNKHVTFSIEGSSTHNINDSTTSVGFGVNTSCREEHRDTKVSEALIAPIVSSRVQSASTLESPKEKLENSCLSSFNDQNEFPLKALGTNNFNVPLSTTNLMNNTTIPLLQDANSSSNVVNWSLKLTEMSKNNTNNTKNNVLTPNTISANDLRHNACTTEFAENAKQKPGFKFDLKGNISVTTSNSFPLMARSLPNTTLTHGTSTFSHLHSAASPADSTVKSYVSSVICGEEKNDTFGNRINKSFTASPFSINKNDGQSLNPTTTPLLNIFAQSATTPKDTNANLESKIPNKLEFPVFPTITSKPLFSFGMNNNTVQTSNTFVVSSFGLGCIDSVSKYGDSSTTNNFLSNTTAPMPLSSVHNQSNVDSVATPFNSPVTNCATQGTTAVCPSNLRSAAAPFHSSVGIFASASSPTPTCSENVTKTTDAFCFGTLNTSFNKTVSTFSDSVHQQSSEHSEFKKPLFGPSSTQSVSAFGNHNISSAAFTKVATTQNSMFGNNNKVGMSNSIPTFNSNINNSIVTSTFGINQKPGFNNSSSNDTKAEFTVPPFSFSSNTSVFNPTVTNCSTTSNNSFGSSVCYQQANNPLSSTLSSASVFEKSAGNNSVQTTSFSSNQNFGQSNFPASQQKTQNNMFNFGSNTANKSGVFSFGTNESPKPSFNFQPEANSNIYSVNSTGFHSNSSSTINSLTTPFNVQPSGGNMFNIGAGSSSAHGRSRTQHKVKRRT